MGCTLATGGGELQMCAFTSPAPLGAHSLQILEGPRERRSVSIWSVELGRNLHKCPLLPKKKKSICIFLN